VAVAARGAVPALRDLPSARKLAAAAAFALAACMLRHPCAVLPGLAMGCFFLLKEGLPADRIARALAPVNLFCLFLWIMLPLGGGGELFRIGPAAVGREGLETALLITLKANAMILVMLCLPGTSGISANCRALLRLHVPEKLVFLLLVTQANLDILARAAASIRQAARLRGFMPGTNPATYRASAWLAAMILVRAWRRSQNVQQAMRMRGFCGRFPLFDDPPSPAARRAGTFLFVRVTGVSVCMLCLDKILG
jgi:cobalt/nickel transport system permease protein